MIRDINMRTIAFLGLGVFVAWVIIDSTPKIARIYTAHGACGTWSGECPRVDEQKSEPEWTWMQSEEGKQYTRDCIKSIHEFGVRSPSWGRDCNDINH